MDEQNNSIPEQGELQTTEQEQKKGVQEQNPDTKISEQIDYKSELEKANAKNAELTKQVVRMEFNISDADIDGMLKKADKLVDEEITLKDALTMLAVKYPDKIKAVEKPPIIDMGGSTSGVALAAGPYDSFTRGFSETIPDKPEISPYEHPIQNTYYAKSPNTVKDRGSFYNK